MFSTNFTNIEINPLSEVIDNDPVSCVYKKAKDFKSQASQHWLNQTELKGPQA